MSDNPSHWHRIWSLLGTATVKAFQLTIWLLHKIFQLWGSILPKIRSVLPASLQAKLSDLTLTAIAVGIFGGLICLTSMLSPMQKPAQVAQLPPLPRDTSADTSVDAKVSQSAETEDKSAPKLDLFPQQQLIAAIQDRLAAITSQYADGLIKTFQADFRAAHLIVSVSDDWYDMSESSQNEFAAAILKHANSLEFRQLEIIASDGILLARNPVVGPEMIIMQRQALQADMP
ncbi:MAG: hypothetical protein F6K19_17300 [Cyanothece sp. SIO1E1]|nr:hypothetical protein [Cyanothece sp. SIO1E1]